MSLDGAILARGPWQAGQVDARWSSEQYQPSARIAAAADRAIDALRDRGSPSHDGVSGRLVGHRVEDDRLILELQPVRWGLRLVEGDASDSITALCLTRAPDGRWLAGHRAPWLASWPGRWALGAAGAVDPFESPIDTLVRELREEWGVEPARVQGEALVMSERRLAMFVGTAWLSDGFEITPDDEHDSWAWWPASVDDWPAVADEGLRQLGRISAGS